VSVAEWTSVERVVAECERYWRSTGVPAAAVEEMNVELTSHLNEARAEGKTVQDVVGPDLAAFAEEWAAEHRPPRSTKAPTPPKTTRTQGGTNRWMWITIGLAVLAFAALVVVIPKEDTVDAENWQWIWVVAAVILAIGELLTAGFFLLPFAVGAAAAAILAFAGASPVWQLLAFTIISVGFLVLLQRYARRREDDDVPARAGADRYHGRTALVVEPVYRLTGAGQVRMETEDWRATTDSDDEIPAGVEVRVIEVRGTRLVVEPIEPSVQ
jgi:membrane protein implicated in regulation of membrane protease activity